MLEIARYEGKKRVKGSLVLGGLLAVMSLLFIGFFPSVTDSGVDLDAYLESMPPALQAARLPGGLPAERRRYRPAVREPLDIWRIPRAN